MCSPSSGGGVRIEAGVAGELEREPTWRSGPRSGCSTSTRIPRAAPAANSNAARTSWIGPQGSRPRRAARARSRRPPLRTARPGSGGARSRWATRSPLVANRGSVASPGSPIAGAEAASTAARCRPPGRSRRRRWRTSRTGTMFGWALPRRPGCRPVANAFCAWLTSTARVDSSSDTSIRWPIGRPPASRLGPRPRARAEDGRPHAEQAGDDVADRDADLRRRAAFGIGQAGDRHQAGRRPGSRSRSRAARRRARSCRSPLIARWTSRRVQLRRASSSENPSRSNPPTRKFSTRTSARPSSRRRTSRPAGVAQVEPDAPLVAVDREVVGRGAGSPGRAVRHRPTAGPRPASRRPRAARP